MLTSDCVLVLLYFQEMSEGHRPLKIRSESEKTHVFCKAYIPKIFFLQHHDDRKNTRTIVNQRGQIHCAGGKIHSRRNLTATGPASFLSITILYHDHGLLHAEKFRLKFDRITLSMLLL